MYTRLFVFLCLVFVVNIGFGQQKFHRTYPLASNKEAISISSAQLKSGNFVALELVWERDVNNVYFSDSIIVTNYKAKGDINWSKRIAIDETKKD
ncbi:MAG: hypothetical protein IPO92_07640 [Saprospiraceae bacterium]|nr:hypothetical protein [Saprospiraceae bacterium]